VYLKVVV
jgi:uncharacterized protein YlxP (DUF503 family)